MIYVSLTPENTPIDRQICQFHRVMSWIFTTAGAGPPGLVVGLFDKSQLASVEIVLL